MDKRSFNMVLKAGEKEDPLERLTKSIEGLKNAIAVYKGNVQAVVSGCQKVVSSNAKHLPPLKTLASGRGNVVVLPLPAKKPATVSKSPVSEPQARDSAGGRKPKGKAFRSKNEPVAFQARVNAEVKKRLAFEDRVNAEVQKRMMAFEARVNAEVKKRLQAAIAFQARFSADAKKRLQAAPEVAFETIVNVEVQKSLQAALQARNA